MARLQPRLEQREQVAAGVAMSAQPADLFQQRPELGIGGEAYCEAVRRQRYLARCAALAGEWIGIGIGIGLEGWSAFDGTEAATDSRWVPLRFELRKQPFQSWASL